MFTADIKSRTQTRRFYGFLGQSDIKKLRRENEQLRKEIWCLRDEYDRLEELLKRQRNGELSCENDEVYNFFSPLLPAHCAV